MNRNKTRRPKQAAATIDAGRRGSKQAGAKRPPTEAASVDQCLRPLRIMQLANASTLRAGYVQRVP